MSKFTYLGTMQPIPSYRLGTNDHSSQPTEHCLPLFPKLTSVLLSSLTIFFLDTITMKSHAICLLQTNLA